MPAAGLASRWAVGPGTAMRAAALVPAQAGAVEIDAAVRRLRADRLAGLADKVDRLATWSDLILPQDMIDSLRELIARVQHRDTVLRGWGMERVSSSARAVTALFQGGPGTGKTLAAGVLARELGYDLYRVDISRVMSRWLGETEKNLARIFDAASDGETILLFDEADTLFGRRTEVKSSHDRYANVETNYLLQRLDSWTGIAVLTTNFGTSIDPAFRRRLTLQLQFPFPDDDERTRLWRAHLPPTVPTTGELDLAAIATRFKLSGGYIRNAALRACYLAAGAGAALTTDHLVRAIQLEYRDMAKVAEGGRLE
jgi:SpoVK/Ycf46/Vps4 family AAA+-type ATPase